MKRIGLGLSVLGGLLAMGLIAGCKDKGGGGDTDAGKSLDGFVNNTCTSVDGCTPTPCQTAKCNPVTHMCQYTDKVCDAVMGDDPCTMRVCDPTSPTGACTPQPITENGACTTAGTVDTPGDPGVCLSGVCTPVPTCAPGGTTLAYAFCDSADYSERKGNNGTTSVPGGMPVIGAYPCAPMENGPEIAYLLDHDTSAGDEDITISLRPVNSDGTPASTDDKDLDLIVLEDVCTATAKCMNPAASGGGFQGVTAGTAKERLTFRAAAGKSYYVVVDGKDMNQFRDYILEVEACGKCQPTATTRLDCNMTMPINTSTASGAAQITDYMCGTTPTAVSAPGKEIPFYFRTPDSGVRNITANLTGATADYRLMVLPTTFYGQCDPTSCLTNVSGPAATNSITWKADPSFSKFARYWVMVDTPTMTDASFGLELACAPYCLTTYDLECGSVGLETNIFSAGTTVGQPALATKWGPGAGCDGLTGLTGPETTVSFISDKVGGGGLYEIHLAGKTAGKNLSMTILDGGTTTAPACDPTMACVTNTVLGAGAGFTGTRTTNGTTTPAGISFTAAANHTYFIVVDGTDASGADFSMQVVGKNGGAGCP